MAALIVLVVACVAAFLLKLAVRTESGDDAAGVDAQPTLVVLTPTP
jgi:hypothetical protein